MKGAGVACPLRIFGLAMSVVSSLGILFDTNAGNHTVTATPAVGDLIVIVCANTGRTTAQPPTVTDNNSDGLGTYTQVKANTKNTSADSVWVFVRNALVVSASSTVFTAAQASDTGGGLQVFKATAMSIVGARAVRQSAGQDNQAAAGTPTPVFAVAVLTGNPYIGAVLNATNPATMTAPASATESQDVGYATPTTGLETVFRNSGFTGTSLAWGGTSASAFASIAVELDTSVPQEIGVRERYRFIRSVARAANR